jgi:tetratricopeptide (TPR) repeat protein
MAARGLRDCSTITDFLRLPKSFKAFHPRSKELLGTNCHVVEGSSFLRIRRGNEKWSARLVGAAPNHDICVLSPGSSKAERWDLVAEFKARWPDAGLADQIISKNLQDPAYFRSAFPDYDGLTDAQIRQHVTQSLKPHGPVLVPLEIVPSSTLTTGERAYAVGAPEGLELTFSEGVISALRDMEGVRIIQTSAAISPGSSGGGLFDTRGRLVGITTLQFREGQSLNFALPGEWIQETLDKTVASNHKSSPAPTDSELESNTWLQLGLEELKDENYSLAVHSLQKSANLEVGEAYRAWFELGKLRTRVSGSSLDFLSSDSTKYKDWVCGEVQCITVVAERYVNVSEAARREAQARIIAAFENSIRLKPDYAAAWIELARIHSTKSDNDQAISEAKEATRLAPGNWEGWELLGASYFNTESYAQAINAVQAGYAVTPKDKKASMLLLLGLAYAEEGNRGQVVRIYAELKASDPKEAESFFKAAVLPHKAN